MFELRGCAGIFHAWDEAPIDSRDLFHDQRLPGERGKVLGMSIAVSFSMLQTAADRPGVDHTIRTNRERGLDLSSNQRRTDT